MKMDVYWLFVCTFCLLSGVHKANLNEIEDTISRNVLNMGNLTFGDVWAEFVKVCPYDHCTKTEPVVDHLTKILTADDCVQNCSCRPNCVMYDGCCPSVWYGYLNYECVGTSIYGTHSESYNMIGQCPPHIDVTDNKTKPVTSERTKLTYKNSFIARCNGELDADLIMWLPSVVCKEGPWDPVVNSFVDLRNGLNDMLCDIRYEIPDPYTEYSPGRCAGFEYDVLKFEYKRYFETLLENVTLSCNTSGTWQRYDMMIDNACQKLIYPYNKFKNPFCFMCNPGLSEEYYGLKHKIDECNVTGMWVNFKEDYILQRCLLEPETPYHWPFKNIYCRICNGMPTTYVRFKSVEEIWLNIEHIPASIMTGTLKGMYDSQIGKVNTSADENTIWNQTNSGDFKLPIYISVKDNNVSEIGLNWDVRYFDSFGANLQCGFKTDFEYDKCDKPVADCTKVDDIVSCLTEDAAQYAKPDYDCTRYFKAFDNLSASSNYIKSLWNISKAVIGEYLVGYYFCSESVIPNEKCHPLSAPQNCTGCCPDTETIGYHPTSFSCLFCNTNGENEPTLTFDIRIECDKPVLGRGFPDVISLLEAAKQCFVEFVPTGVKDNRVTRYDECIDMPWESESACGHSDGSYWFGTYRKLFSIPGVGWESAIMAHEVMAPNETRVCGDQTSQIPMESNECRELFCSPDHILVNGTCMDNYDTYGYLLYQIQYTYMVTMGDGTDGSETERASITLMDAGEFVLNQLMSYLQRLATVYVQELTTITGDPCRDETDEQYLTDGSSVQINISLAVYFTENVTKIEEYLVDTLQATHIMHDTMLILTPSETSYEFEVSSGCLYHRTEEISFASSDTFQNFHKVVKVNTFLVCPLVELHDYELVMDNITEEIRYLPINLLLQDNMYFRSGDAVIMCYNDFKSLSYMYHEIPQTLFLSVYKIADHVSTILSLTCLGLCFVIYCLFKVLRNVPGQNNMNLVVCLFCAQITLKFGLWQPTKSILCQIFGIAIHFFWIATFCSMNVCALHMHHVFSSRYVSVQGMSKKRTLAYYMYTYLTPAACVIVTVACHLILTDGSSIGYGETICFLTNQMAVLIAFIAPSVVIFLANGIMFVVTYISIRKTLQSTKRLHAVDRNMFFVYIRLWTLLGITWPLLIVDANFPMSVFSFVALAFNTLQGFFIFVSFVMNKRVFNLVRTLVSGTDETIDKQLT